MEVSVLLKVTYDPAESDMPAEQVARMAKGVLDANIGNAIANGALTGDTPLVVGSHDMKIWSESHVLRDEADRSGELRPFSVFLRPVVGVRFANIMAFSAQEAYRQALDRAKFDDVFTRKYNGRYGLVHSEFADEIDGGIIDLRDGDGGYVENDQYPVTVLPDYGEPLNR